MMDYDDHQHSWKLWNNGRSLEKGDDGVLEMFFSSMTLSNYKVWSVPFCWGCTIIRGQVIQGQRGTTTGTGYRGTSHLDDWQGSGIGRGIAQGSNNHELRATHLLCKLGSGQYRTWDTFERAASQASNQEGAKQGWTES